MPKSKYTKTKKHREKLSKALKGINRTRWSNKWNDEKVKYPIIDGKKLCNQCKRWVKIGNYFKGKANGKLQLYCKDCNRKYRIANKQREYKRLKKWRRTPEGFYVSKWRGGRSKANFSQEAFVSWDKKQERKCFYCDLPEELINKIELFSKKIGRGRHYRLTIDRCDNNRGYYLDNMVLACPICNQTKGYAFGKEEFRELAQKYIKPKWEEDNETKRT